tara:strand:- start:1656 stop:2417 length:762 start_codon:yes stop_codon:yes gene_type:complete
MEFMHIPLSHIVIPDYQRKEDTNRVNRIAADFEWEAIGVGVVTPGKNGVYHLCNAQHRYAAIRLVAAQQGIDIDDIFVPVQITSLDGFYLYCTMNTNVRALNNNEIFWAMLCGEVPIYVYIANQLSKIGLEIQQSQSRGQAQLGKIKSTHAIYKIYRDFGKKRGNKVLSILRDHFSSPDGNVVERSAKTERFLNGIHEWIKEYNDLSGLDVALRKNKLSSDAIRKKAQMNADGSGYTEITEIMKQLHKIYRKG